MITDMNGVAGSFNFSSPTPGMTFDRNGNNLTVSTPNIPTAPIEVDASRSDLNRSAIVFWSADPIDARNSLQALVTIGQEITDPLSAFMRVDVTTGSLRINKTVEHWHTREGFQFEVRRVADNHLVGTFTSPAAGKIYIPNLIVGDYSIREIVPNGFVAPTPNPRTVTVRAGQTGNAAASTTFNNIRQRGTITITKLDSATGNRPQGDASLNGAIFDIYDSNGQRVDTIHTGSTNTGRSSYLPLSVYYVVERTPPRGYTLDTTRHRVEITYFEPHVAIGNIDSEVRNRVIRGRISLMKFTDPPSSGNQQIMPPLAGARFEIFLRSAGSFENALESERAIIISDSNGFAGSPLLPYGWYTVRETYAPRDMRLVNPFDVFISEEGQVHRFFLNNTQFTRETSFQI